MPANRPSPAEARPSVRQAPTPYRPVERSGSPAGSLGFDATGVEITFNWANGTHSFDGHVSWGSWLTLSQAAPLVRIVNFPLPGFGWLIDGQVTVQGGGGPGHVSGHQV
jgi:hypothetical protein